MDVLPSLRLWARLRDRPLRHIETAGQLGLAHRFGMAQLVEADLLGGLLLGPVSADDGVAATPQTPRQGL
jgi:hypothetical protein